MRGLKPIDLTPQGSDTVPSLLWGLVAAALLIAGIVIGSRGFKDFDPALVSYAGATVFAAFGLGYRYAMWLRRPPTRLYWFRGWQIFLDPKRLPSNCARLVRIFWNNVVLQRFIEKRSKTRWTAHWFLAWGCLIAAAVTFPLSFGWIRFETAPDNQQVYRAFIFGIHVASFPRDRVQTAPQVCMHCEDPICARVCPADAIKKTADGVVQSSLKPRCIGCSNCVLACPFGVPRYQVEIDQMMKCDMCYDRTSVDKKPMCATVCPSGALSFATAEEIQRSRRGIAINTWKFGNEEVKTKVFVIVPHQVERVHVELMQISPTPSALPEDPYDVALMLESVE